MEKESRMNKYKKLREEMKEEVSIHQQAITKEEDDDDFLSFLPKQEKQSIDDTLLEPLSYETMDKNNEQVQHALNKAKVDVRKNQYNTRLDILNKIKKEEANQAQIESEEDSSHLLDHLAKMSPQKDVEELREFQARHQNDEIEDEVEESRLSVIMNYVIVLFMLIALGVCGMIVYQWFF